MEKEYLTDENMDEEGAQVPGDDMEEHKQKHDSDLNDESNQAKH